MATESECCVDELIMRSIKIDEYSRNLETITTEGTVGEARELLIETRAYINGNKSVIPSYIVKKTIESLDRLEKQIDSSSKSKLKFKFSSKATRPKLVENPSRPLIDEKDTSEITTDIANKSFFGFRDRTNECLSLSPEDVESKDISLVGLNNCNVTIIGLANTVYISNLSATKVIICLASRAITLRNCSDCTFELVCQQLRIDSTEGCTFKTFTSARSMLESSKDLRFAELSLQEDLVNTLSKERIQDMMAVAKFNPAQNNWRCIDDFDWLSESVPSSNYKLL